MTEKQKSLAAELKELKQLWDYNGALSDEEFAAVVKAAAKAQAAKAATKVGTWTTTPAPPTSGTRWAAKTPGGARWAAKAAAKATAKAGYAQGEL